MDIGVPTAEGQHCLAEVGIDGRRRLRQVADLATQPLPKRRYRTHGLGISANSVGVLVVGIRVHRIGNHSVLAQPDRTFKHGFPVLPGPDQALIRFRGNAYLQESFPNLDFVRRATVVAQ